MDIGQKVLPFIKHGVRVTGCHTQAMLSSSGILLERIPPVIFEAYTTVPFGVAHISDDPNRLLDSIVDPDIGLERACACLGIQTVFHSYSDSGQQNYATDMLHTLLQDGPVVLGPLDMGFLPYLWNRQQFMGLDHYIVAISYEPASGKLSILDTERVGVVTIQLKEFMPAWRAEGLQQGRGLFSIRQIKHVPRFIDWRNKLELLMENIHDNYTYMSTQELIGLQEFCHTTLIKREQPSLWTGLSFCLKTRVRRLLCCCYLVTEVLGNECEVSKQSLFWGQREILSCQDLLKRLGEEDKLKPEEIKDIVNSELQLGKTLQRLNTHE